MYSPQIRKQTHHFSTPHAHHELPWRSALLVACLIILQQVLFFASIDTVSFANFSKLSNQQTATAALIRLKDSDSITSTFNQSPITLTLYALPGRDELSLTIPKSELGITIDQQRLHDDANRYDPKTLIPLAGLFTDDTVLFADYVSIDQAKLTAYAKMLHEQYYVAPTSATASFPVGSRDIVISPSSNGYSYGADQLAKSLSDAATMRVDQVGLSARVIKPTISDTFLSSQEPLLQRMFDSQVDFSDGDHEFTLRGNNELLAAIEPTTASGYTINLELLATHLESWLAPQYTTLPTSSQLGKTIDASLLASEYAKVLRAGSQQQAIQISHQELAVISDTAALQVADLQQLVSDLGTHYGAAIAVQQFDGDKVSASYDGGQSRIAASTYKLLVAYAVALDISNGTSRWSDSTYNRTTRACLESMLVYSTNHCAENWVKNEYGYEYINELATSIHLTGTCFNCGEYTLASTQDQIKLMQMFYESTGINRDVANIVLDMLDRGRGQNGIPYGSPYKIYNKIGWVPGHYNDTAIIELPNTTIALSIYTDSQNWAQIRDIKNKVIATFEK